MEEIAIRVTQKYGYLFGYIFGYIDKSLIYNILYYFVTM